MAFNVRFRGLISHIEDGGEARAVMVNATGHDALMTIHVDDVVSALTGWPDNPIGVFHVLKISSELILDQAKIDLRVPPTRMSAFNSHVPSLKILLDKDVDADAKKGKVSHPGVAGSLQYGTGDLTTTQCFSAAAKWSGSSASLPECLAKELLYTATPDGSVTIHDAGNVHSVTVSKNATIWITNSDKGKQFKELEKIGFINGAKLVHEPSEDSAVCINCVKVNVSPNTTLECSNSAYP
jgi:hypothetical protein